MFFFLLQKFDKNAFGDCIFTLHSWYISLLIFLLASSKKIVPLSNENFFKGEGGRLLWSSDLERQETKEDEKENEGN